MRIRKDATLMSQADRARFVRALLQLKRNAVRTLPDGTEFGFYDQLVAIHLGVTSRTLEGGAIGDGAHGGPAFLPWHRQYLLMLEDALRTIDSGVTLPYWDWSNVNGTRDIIFQADFMGPAGSGAGLVGRVTDGHFSGNAEWRLINELHRAGINSPTLGNELMRRTRLDFTQLPGRDVVRQILTLPTFEAVFPRRGFRQELEIDPHGRLHIWVGGSGGFSGERGTMSGMSSPNDPIFFLHHGQVDHMWSAWQDSDHQGRDFYPEEWNVVGHGLEELMWPWDRGRGDTVEYLRKYLQGVSGEARPVDMLDFRRLGYTYDSLLPFIETDERVNNQVLEGQGDEMGYRLNIHDRGRYRLQTTGNTDTTLTLHGPWNWTAIMEDNSQGSRRNAAITVDLEPGLYFVVVKPAGTSGGGNFDLRFQTLQSDRPGPDHQTPPMVEIPVNGDPVQGAISQDGERDLFRLNATLSGRYTVETHGETDVFLSLYGPNNPNTLVVTDDDSGQDRNAKIESYLSAGQYYVEVAHYFPRGGGPYGVSARFSGAMELPTLRVNGDTVQGNLERRDEGDLYRFRVDNPGHYIVETSGNTDTFLTLSGPEDQTREISRDDDGGPGLQARIEENLEPGVYYVKVRHYSLSGSGPYGIRVRQ